MKNATLPKKVITNKELETAKTLAFFAQYPTKLLVTIWYSKCPKNMTNKSLIKRELKRRNVIVV